LEIFALLHVVENRAEEDGQMFIDSHVHLGHRNYDGQLATVLERAAAASILHCVMPATDVENTRKLLSLAAEYSQLHACAGIHPCDVDSVPRLSSNAVAADLPWWQDLTKLAQTSGIAAIGEIGLDYYHAPAEGYTLAEWRTQQAEVLRHQLDLAVQLGLNAILHARECHAELVAAVRPYTGKLRCVFHCFTGTLEQAQQVVGMGHLVSFTGVVTFKNSAQIQAAAAGLPAGTFMLETDGPYLAPIPHRGKSCEPAFLADTARFVAQLRGESLESLAAHTTATAQGFFLGLV
jgi:TatD DNase family protein